MKSELTKADIISYIWEHHDRYNEFIKTLDNSNLIIEDIGIAEGDIYRDCVIEIDGRIVEGNAIIFSKLSQWYQYIQKYGDKASQISIVLFEIADISLRSTPYKVTLIEIAIPSKLYSDFMMVRNSNSTFCIEYISRQNEYFTTMIYETMISDRMRDKCNLIRESFLRFNDWDKTFIKSLFDTIAIANENRANFNTLADIIYLDSISMTLETLEETEALLFGTSGLLNSIKDDCEYQKRLLTIFREQEVKYSIKRMKLDAWKLPLKNDIYKLMALLAALIHSKISFRRLLHNQYDIDYIYKVMSVEVSPYWKRHHDFSAYEYPADKGVTLSKSKIDIFIINSIVPMNIAMNAMLEDSENSEKALNILNSIKAESNFITKEWAKYGHKISNAYQSQAIIQLFKKYCKDNLCHKCIIFPKMTKG